MKRRAFPELTYWLVAHFAVVIICSACHHSKNNYIPIGDFKPSQDKKYETKTIPGLPADVISYKYLWQGADEQLWVEYLVRDDQLLYVSRKIGKFSYLNILPYMPSNPVVNACATIETGLQSEIGGFSPRLRQWLMKCVSDYFNKQPVDSLITDREMSYRFLNKEGDVFIDYAMPATMSALSKVVPHN